MGDVRSRVGSLGDVKFRLADWLSHGDAYQRRYVPVEPDSYTSPRPGEAVSPLQDVALWHVDDWSAGEGNRRWVEGEARYNRSDGLIPQSDGSGLGPDWVLQVQMKNASDALDVARAAFAANGKVYLCDYGDDVWQFNPNVATFVPPESVPPEGPLAVHTSIDFSHVKITSITTRPNSAPSTALLYAGGRDNKIHTYQMGSGATSTISGFQRPPIVVSSHGAVYALDGNDLWRVNQSAPYLTKVADVQQTYAPQGFVSAEIDFTDRRAIATGKGVAWLAYNADGTTQIWEYNAPLDTAYVVATLPEGSLAYSIAYHAGIFFAGVTFGDDSYLYYAKGSTVGVAGPFRKHNGTTTVTRYAPFIAGIAGDRLIVVCNNALWGSDLSDGGIVQIYGYDEDSLKFNSVPTMIEGVVVVPRCYNSAMSTNHTAAFVRPRRPPVATGSLDVGTHDFGYPGLEKTLTRVSITLSEPIRDLATRVWLSCSVDGGDFFDIGDVSEEQIGQSRLSWLVSTPDGGTVRGERFELRINARGLYGTVVSMDAEAVGSDSRIEWLLKPDVGWSNVSDPAVTLAGLRGLKERAEVVRFSDPWQVATTDEPEVFDVLVREVFLPASGGNEVEATVRLLSTGVLSDVRSCGVVL